MARVERARSAGGAGRYADPGVRKHVGDGLALDVFEAHVQRVGEPVRPVAVDARVGAFGENRLFEPVAHAPEPFVFGVHAEPGEFARLRESDYAGDVFGPGAADVFLVPAEHERLELRAAPDEHCAHAFRSVELVAADGEHVGLDFREIDFRLAGGLHRIGVEDGPAGLADLRDFRDGRNGARLVVRPHRRDEDGAFRVFEFVFETREVDLPNAVDWKLHHFVAEGLQAAARLEDGRVFDGGRHDFQVLAEKFCRAAYRGVVGFGGARREDDFVGLAIEERRDFLAGAGNVFCDLSAESVHRARVAVKFAEKGRHDINHFRRYAGSGVVVEIYCFVHLDDIMSNLNIARLLDAVQQKRHLDFS